MKRFFYVTSDRSEHLHILFGARVEGAKTACGRRVNKSWRWVEARFRRQRRYQKPVCKQCQSAS